MKTLIIPAAGKSSRFPDMKPKWLLTHPTGELMISKILTTDLLLSYDKVYITILQYHVTEYDALRTLNQVIEERKASNCEVVVLADPTKSASETVYRTITQKNITGALTVKDSDCIANFDPKDLVDYIVGLDINNHNVSNPGNKSYLFVDEHNTIRDIVEKSVVSNIMCAGVYSIGDIAHFQTAYNTLVDSGLFDDRELYISHVFSYLIQKQIILPQCIECTQFTDWGTLEDWRVEQQSHRTYFFDIDGVVVENVGKYGKNNWYNTNKPIEQNIQTIRKLAQQGNQIIFVTARDEQGIQPIVQILKQCQIAYHSIVTNCYHSQRIIVNDHSNTNPYPSCIGISINRNELLKNYI